MKTRRSFIERAGRLSIGGALSPLVTACGTLQQGAQTAPLPEGEHYDLVVIGTGFGGTMTALTVAYTMEKKLEGMPTAALLRILLLERGTWWTTPMETVGDKQVKAREYLISKGQPTQEFSALNDYRGMLDLVRRCRYTAKRPQGLYDIGPIGKRGPANDGVSVLRASCVGGGSIVYSKIIIRPPETLFDDPRWPSAWRGSAHAAFRARYYRNAVEAISHGIAQLVKNKPMDYTGLTGLSTIITRSAGLPVEAYATNDPTIVSPDAQRPLLQIRIPINAAKLNSAQARLIDRARVFQNAVAQLTPHYGSVDVALNDASFTLSTAKLPAKKVASLKDADEPINNCERHGRCNVGCLPGASQTLNKQLMGAIFGKLDTGGVDDAVPDNLNCTLKRVRLELKALAQVEMVSTAPDGSYRIRYLQRRTDDPTALPSALMVSADRIVLAAGCLGTSELMLRAQRRSAETKGAEGLDGLSPQLGSGFTPNGDHIALMERTKERVNLTFGPVTTSFGQFKADAPRADGFHQVEDQGIPRSLAALTGYGFTVIRGLANDDDGIDKYIDAIGRSLKAFQEIFTRTPSRSYPRYKDSPADMSTDRPELEDELTARIMCVVSQGKDAAVGRFRLEGELLRVKRDDGLEFYQDPIYASMDATLDALAEKLRPAGSGDTFISPLFDAKIAKKPLVLSSHPLGGCPMGGSAATGVVDERGRVYRTTEGGSGFHRGLYIADGSIVPTALGVNPSLTISALSLYVANQMLAEWDQIPARGTRSTAAPDCLVTT